MPASPQHQPDPQMIQSNLHLESLMDQFEQDWQQSLAAGESPPSIESVIADVDPTQAGQCLVELIRLDQEFRWQCGLGLPVEEYLQRFSTIQLSDNQRNDLAFEEYRQRFRRGEDVSPELFGERLSLSVDHWPRWHRSADEAIPASPSSTRRDKITLPETGTLFHGFELVGMLGAGAFGAVYLARQEDLANRFVALKVTELCSHEPQSLAQLQHSNIIPIHSLKQDDQLQSICMPFLGVATLRDLISAAGPGRPTISGKALISTVNQKRVDTITDSLTGERSKEIASLLQSFLGPTALDQQLDQQDHVSTVLWLTSRIADGLAYAHGRGIVHGDMKPANILIADDGEPKLLDFHLSQSRQSDHASTLVGGTLPYMSPKHLRSLQGEGQIDAACDRFSLGVILFEALTGELPYPSETPDAAGISRMLDQRKVLPPFHQYSVLKRSPALCSILEKCLTCDTELAYTSTDQLQVDLQRHLRDLPLKFAANRSLPERMKKWSRRHPAICSYTTATIAFLAVLGIASGIFANRLSNASRLEKVEASREFVRSVESFDSILLVPEANLISHQQRQASLQTLAQFVSDRTLDAPEVYKTKLLALPKEQQQTELQQYCYSNYLLALNDTDPASALKRLDRTIAVAGSAAPTALLQFRRELSGTAPSNDESPAPRINTINEQLLDGLEAIRGGRLKVAEQHLTELIAAQPENSKAWLLLGQCYRQQDLGDNARLCFLTANNLEPASIGPLVHLGVLLLEQNDFESARMYFDQAIEKQPQEPTHFLNRALCRIGTRSLDEAVADLQQAIDLGTNQTRVHYLQHQVWQQLGKQAEAKRAIETFLKLPPQDEVSLITRGLAFARLGKLELARTDFVAATALNPASTDAWQNLATVQAEYLDETEAAIDSLTRIIELHPDDLVARVTRGVLYGRLNQRELAVADAQFVLRQDTSADTLYRAAGVFSLTSKSEKGDAAVALDLLSKAVRKSPALVSSMIFEDPDLAPIKNTSAFQQLIGVLKTIEESLPNPQPVSNHR